jgi:hypothetical protein
MECLKIASAIDSNIATSNLAFVKQKAVRFVEPEGWLVVHAKHFTTTWKCCTISTSTKHAIFGTLMRYKFKHTSKVEQKY